MVVVCTRRYVYNNNNNSNNKLFLLLLLGFTKTPRTMSKVEMLIIMQILLRNYLVGIITNISLYKVIF